jgi:hypothetical protein
MTRLRRGGLAALLIGVASFTRAGGEEFHDPQLALQAEATQAEVVSAFAAYDVPRLWAALERLEARAGGPQAHPLDGYALASGWLQLLVIQRYYQRQDPDALPELLRAHEREELVERGLRAAEAFRARNPAHSDVERVRGELISFQITGPLSGWSKGPEAHAALAEAERKDPRNAWVVFASARMHYHNPAVAGGDKDLALRELRQISPHVRHFRVSLYLALVYQAKDMPAQARYWARAAERQAPGNPEVARLLAGLPGERR